MAPNRLKREFTVERPDATWVTDITYIRAVWKRKPRDEVLVHSDQGCQYGGEGWQRFCRSHKLVTSMSRRRGVVLQQPEEGPLLKGRIPKVRPPP